jgi:hypothetical protein
VNEQSSYGTERICLDLFSGLGGRRDVDGGFSGAFQKADGWDIVTVDFNEEFEPDICANILDLTPEDLPDADVVLASPPCPDFSVACITDKWDHDPSRTPAHLPETASIAESVKIVFHTLWLVHELQPDWWFMENPQGMLRMFIGAPSGQVHYCQYGEDFKKPTDLWGRHPPMEYRRCPGRKRCHHTSNPREVNEFRDESRTRAVDSSNSAERAKIPAELSAAILNAVESAIKSPPAEQTTLVQTDGGCNSRYVGTGNEQSEGGDRGV